MLNVLRDTLENMRRGNVVIDTNTRVLINQRIVEIIQAESWSSEDIDDAYSILLISNILYNNVGNVIIEDGVYDLLVSKYNKLVESGAPVGAPPLNMEIVGGIDESSYTENNGQQRISIARRIPDCNFYNNSCFFNDTYLKYNPFSDIEVSSIQEVGRRVTGHTYPELTGTLDKCKFVTIYQAQEAGVDLNDPTVGIFERDFMHNWFGTGYPICNELICELKYDGISVEVVVENDTIIEAFSRGDSTNDKAVDLTPVFGGLKFPNASGIFKWNTVFGIKCECIITYDNLAAIQRENPDLKYKNARNAVTGITHRKDARRFLQYLTLVPIRTAGLEFPSRETEITFLNRYFTFGIDMHYMIINGSYEQLIYQVVKFVEDAEKIRPYVGFMYDGVVVSVTDPELKAMMGRVNSVDKWSIAIKFNASIKETMFLGYSYSVGQNGVITPMAHFLPVEFLGTIHDVTSAHSYQRVRQLGLKYGDMVYIEYRNDVICYITKSPNQYNLANPNPVIPFIEVCPSCGTPLVFTDKSATCPNIHCDGRQMARISNMVKKLGIKDFSTAYIQELHITSLASLLNYNKQTAVSILGEKLASKLMLRIKEFNESIKYDYFVIGAIGFSSIALERWKIIMANVSIEQIIFSEDYELLEKLSYIKGIGDVAISTIINERRLFIDDLKTIAMLPNMIRTYGLKDDRPKVRFTGIRDKELESLFIDKGFDADGTKQVNKTTDILIVPYEGFSSSKTKKIGENTKIFTPEQARAYLNGIR